jgi:hypothetical protein
MEDLDLLWRSVAARARSSIKDAAAARLKKTADAPKQSTQLLFADPENWERKRGIALIHDSTETLLGNFSEYLHRTIPGCRKLVREEAPIAVESVERVSGSWWLGEERRIEPKQVWHEQRPAMLHVYLDKLQLHSPGCELVAHLSYGSLARVELAADTQFAQTSGGEQLVHFPAGTNLIEVMSRDCKVALMQEVGK